MNKNCIFCKIVSGEIPSDKVFENNDMIVIKDINPQAKLHWLMIPKKHYKDIGEFAQNDGALLARCLKNLTNLIDESDLGNGYRLITNKGINGRQSVEHIHIHVLGGEMLSDKMG